VAQRARWLKYTQRCEKNTHWSAVRIWLPDQFWSFRRNWKNCGSICVSPLQLVRGWGMGHCGYRFLLCIVEVYLLIGSWL